MKRDDRGKLFVCMGHMDIPIAILEAADPPWQVTSRNLPDRLIATTYTLEEEKDGTRVTVTMSGFESLPEDARQERLGPSGTAWEKALENLKAYINGAELPFPEGYVAALFGYRREAKKKFAVERSIWIAASRERVWQAITDDKQIVKWWADYWEIPTLEVGATIKFGSENDPLPADDPMLATIAVLDRPREFAIQWPPQPQYHSIPVFTRYLLEEENGGTRVTVSETGFEALPDDIRQQRFDSTAKGYATVMANLKAYIEDGSV